MIHVLVLLVLLASSCAPEGKILQAATPTPTPYVNTEWQECNDLNNRLYERIRDLESSPDTKDDD